MEESTQKMEERVALLQGQELGEMLKERAEMIDPKEFEVLRTEISRVQKIWRQRRSVCREMVGNLADGMEKRDEEITVEVRRENDVQEMIGLETEEELGIELPFKRLIVC